MEPKDMKLGILGLGKMGGNLALLAKEKGISVVGKSRSAKPHLERKGVKVVDGYGPFVDFLDHPRVMYISVPAGPTVDKVLEGLVPLLDAGDVVIDGGNSFYLDSVRREEDLSDLGIFFLDCGTSGGVEGARKGACFMVGGRKEGFKVAEPILAALAAEGGCLYSGDPGSGHFVKLVQDGVEAGMLQAIGEGVALLRGSDFDLDLEKVFKSWASGATVRGWLVELMAKSLAEQRFSDVPTHVEDTGEVNWLVHDALEKEIPIPVIAQAAMELFRSRDKSCDACRSVALMRNSRGGYPLGKDDQVAKERRASRTEKI
ncbi:NADP-dependent phosphogluconate dehydrogenase [Methanotrichaceae archaeon M04Ac]|uniref:NADP-dependent phosphogluconate dehydrogenase n=1 Tax=Candidatus Methanocrinis alkalitolerans TaxID=3033395 RepID=A0ABT5XDI9_9EURY|nr:NADP-dependent phosphogluconate dehydrogenase [Candidatus Methanocrinis alkalitolerans]MDF0592778.1 NADP-dependent phosphogluconate dehydrogenase [Candidatus Methanocrinis alkalitolerans]